MQNVVVVEVASQPDWKEKGRPSSTRKSEDSKTASRSAGDRDLKIDFRNLQTKTILLSNYAKINKKILFTIFYINAIHKQLFPHIVELHSFLSDLLLRETSNLPFLFSLGFSSCEFSFTFDFS